MGDFIEKVACPVCRAAGGDTKGDNLALYQEHNGIRGHCFNCNSDGWYDSGRLVTSVRKEPKRMPLSKNQYPKINDVEWKSKGISTRVLKNEGIGEVDGFRGRLAFPYYRAGKIVGYKYRDLLWEKTHGEKKIWVEGDLNLFGLQSLKHTKKLIITEGESDFLTLKEMFSRDTYKEYDILGMPGASTHKYITENIALLNQYEKIFFIPDNDAAGRQSAEKLESIPGLSQYKVHIVYLNEYNDVSEYAANHNLFLIRQYLENTPPVVASPFVVSLEDYDYQKRLEQEAKPAFDTGYEALNVSLGNGLHLDEFLGIMSYTGFGKSSFNMNLVNNLITLNPEVKVLFIGTEMSYWQNLKWLAQIRTETAWGIKPTTRREQEASLKQATERFIQYKKDYREFDIQEVYDAIAMFGINVVVFDVITDMWDMGDYKTATEVTRKLHELTKGSTQRNVSPVAVIGVLHTSGSNDSLRSDKTAGGRGVSRQFTSILTIDSRNKSPNTGLPQDEIRVFDWAKKSREHGYNAVGFDLIWDSQTMKYKEPGDAKRTPNTVQRQDLPKQVRGRDTEVIPPLDVRTDEVILPSNPETPVNTEGHSNSDDGDRGESNPPADMGEIPVVNETLHTGLSDSERGSGRVQGVADTRQPFDVPPSLEDIQKHPDVWKDGFNVDIQRPDATKPRDFPRVNPKRFQELGIIPPYPTPDDRIRHAQMAGGEQHKERDRGGSVRRIPVRYYPT